MIINDPNQLKDIPVGTEVTLVQKIKVMKIAPVGCNPCGGCLFLDSKCPACISRDRPDGQEVRYVKI